MHLSEYLQSKPIEQESANIKYSRNASGKQSEQRVYLVGWVVFTKRGDPPGSSWVILVACDALQPQSYGFGRHFFWMDPSGVVQSEIQSHRVIASLERLDAPTEEHF